MLMTKYEPSKKLFSEGKHSRPWDPKLGEFNNRSRISDLGSNQAKRDGPESDH